MTKQFDGRISIVTGAGSGIGFATAKGLALSGAAVILNLQPAPTLDYDQESPRPAESERPLRVAIAGLALGCERLARQLDQSLPVGFPQERQIVGERIAVEQIAMRHQQLQAVGALGA